MEGRIGSAMKNGKRKFAKRYKVQKTVESYDRSQSEGRPCKEEEYNYLVSIIYYHWNATGK